MGQNALYETLWAGNAQSRRLIKLDTPLGVDWLLPLYVKGMARLGRDYEFIIDAVSSRSDRIELNALLSQAVTLWIQQMDGSYMPIHGYVHQFSRLGSDGPLAYFQLRFSSWLYFLRLRRDMRDWQEQTGEQILADVFDEHPQARGAFRFSLQRPLPSYSNRVQWEYDLNFVHRSMEEVGVFPYFEQADDGKSHTMVLTDDSYFVPPLRQSTVQFGRMEIGGELDGLTQWKEQLQIESAKLAARSFDYKRPDLLRQIRGMTDAQGKLPTDGEVYDYPGAYMWPDRRQGERLAQIRLEERMSRMKRFHGAGGLRCAMPGRRFELHGHPVHDSGKQLDREFVLLGVDWLIRNNLPGLDGIAELPEGLAAEIARAKAGSTVRHADGSEGLFQVTVEAQRRDVPFRSPFEHKKPVMQLQNAIVAGPSDEEVYTDALNRVKVWFLWNRRNGQDERASCWVRAAFPDAGSKRGGIQPLRKGDEVVIGFMEGDCDRPFIISRMYGGATQPVWHSNGLLSGYQSRGFGNTGAYNALVHDDATHQGGQRLTSFSGSSYHLLHQGYLINQTGNARGEYLGMGYKLHTDAYGSMRANRGMAISTQSKQADAEQMDVQEARRQLAGAGSLIDALSEAGKGHQAADMKDGHQALTHFADVIQHAQTAESKGGRTAGGGTGTANAFKEPVMLLDSPAGIAASTQKSTHIAADQLINLVSGQNTNIASGQSLLVAALNLISLFAQNGGMKLIAGKGDVEMQAHAGAIDLAAQRALHIRSITDVIEVAAGKETRIMCGGAIIQIMQDGSVNIHSPGKIDFKAASYSFSGPARVDVTNPAFKDSPVQRLMLNTFASPSAKSAVPVGMPYKLYADGALVKQGVIDETGQLPIDHHVTTQKYMLELASGVKHEIPVPGDYRDAANGALANQGFQFHESSSATDITPPGDRASHRSRYSDLLAPASGDEA